MSQRTVFISYRQLNDAERERVHRFGERLRTSGVDVVLDQFYLADHPSGPPAGWPKWSSDQAIHSERVIIVGTECWFRCFDGKEQPGEGLGAACEANNLRQRIYDAAGINENIGVVIFHDSDADHISFELKRYHRFHADRDFEAIIGWLGSDPAAPAPSSPKPDVALEEQCPGDELDGVPPLPDNVVDRIERYRANLKGNYIDAFSEFFQRYGPEKSLNYLLDFEYNRCDLHLELVMKLFVDGVDRDPPGLPKSACAKALNALARAYKNTGRLQRAVDTFRRQLAAEQPSGEPGVLMLQNFVNALRLAGHLREAVQRGHQLWRLSQTVASPKSIGYSLYWNGIVAGVCGDSDHGELLLRQAEVSFEEIAADDQYRGLGRTYAHLAQLELWSGNAELAGRLAAYSYRLAQRHHETRERILTTRLRGIAALIKGDYAESRQWLDRALASATATGVGYEEEELAATVGLAELDHRERKLRAAEHKLREVEVRAREGDYALLQVDVLNALARLLRDDGRVDEGVGAAQRAYQRAWCDGPPYAYGPGLYAAIQFLAELGTAAPLTSTSQVQTAAERLQRDPRM